MAANDFNLGRPGAIVKFDGREFRVWDKTHLLMLELLRQARGNPSSDIALVLNQLGSQCWDNDGLPYWPKSSPPAAAPKSMVETAATTTQYTRAFDPCVGGIVYSDDPLYDMVALPEFAPRSGSWPRVRGEHLKGNPYCIVCGTKTSVQVHHVLPYHLHPDKELDPDNLETLCPPHHILFGHLMNWKAYNPRVREDADEWFKKIHKRPLADILMDVVSGKTWEEAVAA